MAIIELTNSRHVSKSNGIPVGVREFHVHPYANEQQVLALCDGVNLPAKYSRWPDTGGTGRLGFNPTAILAAIDFDIVRDPEVTQAWRVTVTYRDTTGTLIREGRAPGEEGYITMRASAEARFVDEWRQFYDSEDFRQNFERVCFPNSARPQFRVGSPDSDIGGNKIDIAGHPTSVIRPVQRIILDITTYIIPDFKEISDYLGARNSLQFLNAAPLSMVFVGADMATIGNAKYQLTLNFVIDKYYHLKQVVNRTISGYAETDANFAGAAQTAGQAKTVSFVQPFPREFPLQGIHPALSYINF